jgi:UDP:flavonoid glycosyltransferase YjiC (YdhE family)
MTSCYTRISGRSNLQRRNENQIIYYNEFMVSTMNKVYMSLYGVGLGHASRMLLVANRLAEEGTDIKFSSFGDAVNYVNMHGFECFDVPPVEFAWSPDKGFSIKSSITKLPENFVHFMGQCGCEGSNITKFNPAVVVSDTRLSSLVIAKMLGLPTITILNQVKLLFSPRLREVRVARMFERCIGEFLGGLWALSDSVLIPDLPPPYTLSEENLWQVGSVSKKLEYIGFMAPKSVVNEEYIDKVAKLLGFDRNKPTVFAHISGPSATKMLVLKKIIEAMQSVENIQFVVSEGKPNGDTVPRKIHNGWYFEWCPVKDEIFAMSNLLIMRGGHSTLAQAIQYGKPVVTIPIENHGEQLGNAKKVEKIGMGLMLAQKDLRPENISDAVQQVMNDSSFEIKTKMLMEIANKMDGTNTIVQKVRSYL